MPRPAVSSHFFLKADEHCLVNAKLLYQKIPTLPPGKTPNLFDKFCAIPLKFTQFSAIIKWEKVREVFCFTEPFFRIWDTCCYPLKIPAEFHLRNGPEFLPHGYNKIPHLPKEGHYLWKPFPTKLWPQHAPNWTLPKAGARTSCFFTSPTA